MRLIDIAFATDPGKHRKENQDYASYSGTEAPPGEAADVLMVIADGMGGHAGGAVAARMAVEIITEELNHRSDDAVTERLRRAFAKANDVMLRRSEKDQDLKGMGTTLTATVIKQKEIFFAHVGDSRGYVFKNGRMTQFTSDHSLVADLVKQGVIQADEAESHPQANVITRAIGFSAALSVDVDELEVEPDASFLILLCSDGLYKEVDEATIARVLAEESEPEAASNRLVAMANEAGGRDNITVLIARIDSVPNKKANWVARLRGQ